MLDFLGLASQGRNIETRPRSFRMSLGTRKSSRKAQGEVKYLFVKGVKYDPQS